MDSSQLDYACKRELSTFLAHTTQESGSFQFNRELYCYPVWNYGCDYADNGSTFWPPEPGQNYFGRGAFQLSWNYNYGRYSTIAFGGGQYDEYDLLYNPDKVATVPYLAIGSALWYYMTPSVPQPSMHEVATRFFEPNSADESTGNTATFGATINIINGGIECGKGYDT